MSSISLVCHWLFTLFAEQTCAYKSFGDCIWIAVGWGTAVFKVALLFLANRSWNSYASTTVSHSSRELVDIGGLVMASQSSGIVQPSFRIVGTDMVLVSLGQPLNWLLNISKIKLNLISTTKNHFMSALHCFFWGGGGVGYHRVGDDARLSFTLTSNPLPHASPWCWSWCGSQLHSSSLKWALGQKRLQRRSLHKPCAGGSGLSTNGLPSQCPHKGQLGIPTEEQQDNFSNSFLDSIEKWFSKCRTLPVQAWLQH